MRRRGVAAVGGAALLVGAFYLSVYVLQGHRQPLGFDTSRYLWRNRCVAEEGLRGLRRCRPPLATSMPGRVAEPLVVLPARSVLGLPDRAVAAALPAVLAAVIGLGAGALIARTLGAGGSTAALVTVVTGVSAMVVRLAGPEAYADNLLALGLGIAAVATSVSGRRGAVAGALLVGAAGLAHWPTFAIVVAILLGAAALRLRGSLELRSGGRPLRDTPFGGLFLTGVGGMVLWAGAALLVGAGPDRFFADPASSSAKLAADIGGYALPLTIPAAALGALHLWRHRGGGRPTLESILLAWLGVVGIAVAAWLLTPVLPPGLRLLGSGFPLHRFLAMALPVPILVALALRWAGKAIRPRAAAAVTVIAGLTVWAGIGYRMWSDQEPFLDGKRLRSAAAASSYLDRSVDVATPVVAVVDGVGANPFTDLYQLADNLRVPLNPERISRTYLYLGTVENLQRGEPTLTGDPGYDAASLFRWRALGRVLERGPVVLIMDGFTPEFATLAGQASARPAGPGVLALEGPAPVPGGVTLPGPMAGPGVAASFLGILGLLAMAGGGWALALGRLRSHEAMAMAPALGAGALVWVGVVADRLGIRPWGWGGLGIVAVVTAAGAAVALRRRRGGYSASGGSARREST